MHPYRTHTCGQLRSGHAGLGVRLAGFVHRTRDHGGLLFLDLRDEQGITQIVLQPEIVTAAIGAAGLTRESVVAVDGTVVARAEGQVNAAVPSGRIEVHAESLQLLSAAEGLPFPIDDEHAVGETTRLEWRFVDLRRPQLHHRIQLRARIVASLRRRLEAEGFAEVTTPLLTSSSPEGARDFLVPSRLHPGRFYALPQAPQQFKQLLMAAGFERYYQIAPCFRDEDARADRFPGEFYQADLEMAYATQEDVFAVVERVFEGLFREFAEGRSIGAAPFPRIPHERALLEYGSDKPDLRVSLRLAELTDLFAASDFRTFRGIVDEGGVVRCLPLPGVAAHPRSFFTGLEGVAREHGLGGLAWLVRSGGSFSGPVARALGEDLCQRVCGRAAAALPGTAMGVAAEPAPASGSGAAPGAFTPGVGWASPRAAGLDGGQTPPHRVAVGGATGGGGAHLGFPEGAGLLFVAGPAEVVTAASGALRLEAARRLGLVDTEGLRFCWVTDFPFYERDPETGNIAFAHNPFSMPAGGLQALTSSPPLEIRARQYDFVCNGLELSSGAERNHRPEVMLKAFELAGYPRAEVEARFGAMLRAFRCGCPPHAGIAPGVDRVVMLLAGAPNLREVTAFPKDARARDLLMGAPAPAMAAQLRELGIG